MRIAIWGGGAFLGAVLLGAVVMTSREVRYGGMVLEDLRHQIDSLQGVLAAKADRRTQAVGRPNVVTDFSPESGVPEVAADAFVDPQASLLGRVSLGHGVYVAPFASVRGDEGQPIAIGDGSNLQDGAVVHALETVSHGQRLEGRAYRVNGVEYAVWIGRNVSIAHQALVHGPAKVEDDVFIGMQAMVFKASVGRGSVVEPGAKVIGVAVPPGRYVPAGVTVTTQQAADALPEITDRYVFRDLNDAVLHVNRSFADAYLAASTSGSVPADTAVVAHGKPH